MRMDPFPSVVVDGVEIAVDQDRPVAALTGADGETRFTTWPDLDAGPVAPEATLLPAPDGAWVWYPPETAAQHDDSHDALLAGRDSPAVHIDADGAATVVRIGSRAAIGATRGRLWTAIERAHTHHRDHGEGDGAMPPGWEDPTELVVHRLDGSRSTVRVDRHVLAVFEDDAGIHLLVRPAAPIAHPSGFEHRLTLVDLPGAAPLPDRIRFLDEHPDGVGPAAEPRRVLWRAHEWALPDAPARAIDLPDLPDLADVPGAAWQRVALTLEEIEGATRAAAQWFGDPSRFWHGEDGSTGPLARGMRDAEVHLEGEWPGTRVVITFAFPSWTDARLRRALRVFDDAGRATAHPYAGIHLMEHLATAAPPPLDRLRDGHLDV